MEIVYGLAELAISILFFCGLIVTTFDRIKKIGGGGIDTGISIVFRGLYSFILKLLGFAGAAALLCFPFFWYLGWGTHAYVITVGVLTFLGSILIGSDLIK